MKALTALLAGVTFGAGLAISGMINPARVQAFLDVAGTWDPALAFVMAAAIPPAAIAYLIRRRMEHPVLADRFFVPVNRALDKRLITGAAVFGVGWGLAGFCPGPAVASLVVGAWQPWLFVVAMLIGMGVYRMTTVRPAASSPRS